MAKSKIVLDASSVIKISRMPGRTKFLATLCTSFDVFISQDIVGEVENALKHKFYLSASKRKSIINSLSRQCTVVDVNDSTSVVTIRDKGDEHVLRLCQEVFADTLVTEDKDFIGSELNHRYPNKIKSMTILLGSHK